MSDLYNVSQEHNPIYKQAELADLARDRAEIEEAKKIAQEYHTRLLLQGTLGIKENGDGMSRDSQLLFIYAKKAIRG